MLGDPSGQSYCNMPAVGNMAVVYNGCQSNQSTIECDVKQYGGR
jgi:hypothetical protein